MENSSVSPDFYIFLAFVFVVAIFFRIFILKNRAANKIAMENKLTQQFLQELLGKNWHLISSVTPNWKQIKILQPMVDSLLVQKAVALNIACKTATYIINHPLSESRPNEGPDELGQRIQRLEIQESEIEACKKIYWNFSDRAKRLGFKVKESHKEYLPENVDYSEEPKKSEGVPA